MNLPFEILKSIFQQTSRRDRFQCQKVCRKWSLPAQNVIYEIVVIYSQEAGIKYFDTIIASPQLGRLAKRVRNPSPWINSNFVSLVAAYCPNVQVLLVNEPDSEFYTALIAALEAGSLSFLKSLPLPDEDSSLIGFYNTCILLCSSRIKFINLNDSFYRSSFEDLQTEEFNRLESRLNEFSGLTDLMVRKHTNKSIIGFDKIFEDCPLVTKVDFNLHSLEREELTVLDIDDDADNYHKIVNLDTIRPRPDINVFQGGFVFFSDQSLKYFMHKFPNLSSLNLSSEDENVTMAMVRADLSTDTMLEFFKYLLKIPAMNVDHMYISDAVGFLTLLLDSVDVDVEILFDPDLTDFLTDVWEGKGPRIKLFQNEDSKKPRLGLVYHHGFQDPDPMDFSQHKALIEGMGNKFKHLHLDRFDIGGSFRRGLLGLDNTDCELEDGGYLEHLFKHCTELKSLKLCYSDIGNMVLDAEEVVNTSLEKLETKNYFPPDIDLLTNFSSIFPNLKHLKISWSKSLPLYKIIMPYTSFDTLSFHYDNKHNKHSTHFILKVLANGKPAKYYVDDGDTLSPCSAVSYKLLFKQEIDFIMPVEIVCKEIKLLKYNVLRKMKNEIHF